MTNLKSFLSVTAILVASLLFAACPSQGDETIEIDGGGGNGTLETGVFATFIVTPGKFTYYDDSGVLQENQAATGANRDQMRINLSYNEKPILEFAGLDYTGNEYSGAISDEASFTQMLKDLGEEADASGKLNYDYADDPLKLGPNAEGDTPSVYYTITATHYVYQLWTENGVSTLTNPSRANYLFTGWKVDDLKTTITGIAKGDVFDPASWTAECDNRISAKTQGYTIKLVPNWIDDPNATAASKNLEDAIDSFLKKGSLDYDDDYLIGSGTLTEATDEQKLNYTTLQNALEEAQAALAGETKTVMVAVDGEYDDEGNAVEIEIKYFERDMDRVQASLIQLNAMKADPRYQFNSFVSKRIEIPYSGEFKSVTVTAAGVYEIELFGASGGHIWSTDGNTALGGYGGHVKGTVQLAAGDVLKVYVGGEGTGTAIRSIDPDTKQPKFTKNGTGFANKKTGGYNGGGEGGASDDSTISAGGSGGGATDVRFIGTYSDGVTNKDKTPGTTSSPDQRILVAGGGGGAGQSASIMGDFLPMPAFYPGIGGGAAGKAAIRTGSRNDTSDDNRLQTYSYGGQTLNKLYSRKDNNGVTHYWGYIDGAQAGDSTTVAGKSGTPGSKSRAWEGTGGGGGGYRGGGVLKGTVNSNGTDAHTGGGAGGTNFISGATSGTDANFVGGTTNAGKTVTDTTDSSSTYISDYYGDGKAIIEYKTTAP
ncbi:MAG: hypothetical protein Ta2B_25340 [Termitinemataceae bacterium]|nr:MAG: hypothetical protein Ta2B_25340 [Termitinemataceae bacterium]